MKALLAAAMIIAGILHFLKTDFYVRIVPDYLPHAKGLVLASGAAAILLGILLLGRKTSRAAALGIALFLFAVFPANIHLALHPEILPQFPAWMLWARLPLQAVLLTWAAFYIR